MHDILQKHCQSKDATIVGDATAGRVLYAPARRTSLGKNVEMPMVMCGTVACTSYVVTPTYFDDENDQQMAEGTDKGESEDEIDAAWERIYSTL